MKFRAGFQKKSVNATVRKPVKKPTSKPGTVTRSVKELPYPDLKMHAGRGGPRRLSLPGQKALILCDCNWEPVGIGPDRLSLARERVCSFAVMANDCGISPERRLLDSSRDVRGTSPIFSGMLPVNEFHEKSKCVIFTSLATSAGIFPTT